jgi:hypothetical protein
VRCVQDFGNGPDQLQSLPKVKLIALGSNEMVEPLRPRVVFKD